MKLHNTHRFTDTQPHKIEGFSVNQNKKWVTYVQLSRVFLRNNTKLAMSARVVGLTTQSLPDQIPLKPSRQHLVAPEVNLRITQARKYAGDPPWLWDRDQTSPEVQNRRISGPTKMTMSSKNFKKTFCCKTFCHYPFLPIVVTLWSHLIVSNLGHVELWDTIKHLLLLAWMTKHRLFNLTKFLFIRKWKFWEQKKNKILFFADIWR